MFASLLIALVALGVAIAALLRPVPAPVVESVAAPPETFTEEQVADAKAKVCAAYEKVRRAGYMNLTRNGGDDPTAQLAVAVNQRQIWVAGSAYLLTTLSDQPATPSDLTKAVTNLAYLYQVTVLNFLASDDSENERNETQEIALSIESLCE